MATLTKKPELTDVQQAVLDALIEDDRSTLREVADKIGVSVQTVHIAVQVLAAFGLITRQPGKQRSIRIVEARA